MLAQFSTRQKIGYGAIVAMVLFGMTYSGAKYLQPATSVKLDHPSTNPSAETPEVVGDEVIVHVAGAVKVPGLLHMASGDRVGEAIKKAGGAKDNADLDQLNLAAKLVDGTQVFVPTLGEEPKAAPLTGRVASNRGSKPRRQIQIDGNYMGGSSKPESSYEAVGPIHPPEGTKVPTSKSDEPSSGGLISLNSASQEQLESLPGIGPATAKKIIDFRSQQGKFTSIEQLEEVKGIGQKKMEAIRGLVRL